MKVVVLKGGDEAVPLAQCVQSGPSPSRAAGAAALSGDGRHWALLNVSPAVAEQLATDARLLRHHGLPDAAVRTVVLTDAQMDHVTGLLSLRDGPPIHLYATPAVFEELTTSVPVLPMLQHYCGVHWHVIPVAGECRTAVFHVEGQPSLEFTAVATDGPSPRHSMHSAGPVVGETIALAVLDLATGQRFFCASSLASAGAMAVEWMREADCVMVGDEPDSTLSRYSPDAANDAWALLDGVRARRKLLLAHPDGAGPQRQPAPSVMARWGLELASDRMEIEL
ncbi:pyrroloquinoline quinone biosynthesis protein PqqB [Leptothrix cholodnii SP-6]|uniref:Coenzyme PQQ synthesis protein B n=1 Tax=Leptothrix cholodnii (strain ATCC 51168 / LMG 8142 / SP-6) TaxID=395495 RepID=B1XZ40_LEPCP|nr:MBL fold metallo-hydrolase [Leptothrix cholodnii]ACB34059.1 pyrroloquinoline quinone biosynthesis protein PqqB [Leptothrix cholodnii SP-6]